MLGHDLACKGDRAFAQLAFLHDLIDQAHLETGLGRHVLAAGDHFQRLLYADDARQALGAARPRQQAERHFRQAASRRRHGHAVVAGQSCLEAAAERGAMNGGDHRLGRILHGVLHVEQARAPLRAAEFGDVGAGDERATRADQHHGLGAGVRHAAFHAAGQAIAHRGRKSVHRRGVEGDDADIALQSVVGDGVDGAHGVSLVWLEPTDSAQVAAIQTLVGCDRRRGRVAGTPRTGLKLRNVMLRLPQGQPCRRRLRRRLLRARSGRDGCRFAPRRRIPGGGEPGLVASRRRETVHPGFPNGASPRPEALMTQLINA